MLCSNGTNIINSSLLLMWCVKCYQAPDKTIMNFLNYCEVSSVQSREEKWLVFHLFKREKYRS